MQSYHYPGYGVLHGFHKVDNPSAQAQTHNPMAVKYGGTGWLCRPVPPNPDIVKTLMVYPLRSGPIKGKICRMLLRKLAQFWKSKHRLWLLPSLVFLFTFLIGWLGSSRLVAPSPSSILVILCISSMLAGLSYLIVRYQLEQRRSHVEIEHLSQRVSQVNSQILGVYQLSSLYAQATTEVEIIAGLLKICLELVGAQGASFVPLDDRNQPMVAHTQGELPFQAMNSWVEYLASPSVRQRCRQCQSHEKMSLSCPLAQGPFAGVAGLFCLPLTTGNREWGILNLYMPNTAELDPEILAFLKIILQDTALALETKRLRQRELDAIQQMRAIQQKTDLSGLLTSLLENIKSAYQADLALIELQTDHAHRRVVVGETDKQTEIFVQKAIDSCLHAGESIQIQTTLHNTAEIDGQVNLLAVPLLSQTKWVIGALLILNRSNPLNHAHQLNLLHAFAAQVELVVENADLLTHIEYRTIIEERTRLAREIHDGLAQTLGLLKLQSLQALNYLNRSDFDKLQSTLTMVHESLSEAYQDIRAAIDGLRMNADQGNSLVWVKPILKEFEDLSGIDTHLELIAQPEEVPAEIQTQLIRIIQEALNNIRKHSQAKNVWLSSTISAGDWWLEVRDDGVGFAPEDIPRTSRYGLIGMRERADLIGADFQIVSQPEEGTQIRLRLPAILLNDWTEQDLRGAARG